MLSILRASPFHLLEQLTALPPSLHSYIVHAAFPGLASGDLTLPCAGCAILPATKALEMFAALPEDRQRRLTVTGVNCMVSPSDQRPVPGKSAQSFRHALLRCCRGVRDLSLSLEGHRAHLTPVFQALVSSSTLRTLNLTLPSTYSFQSTGPGDNACPEESVNAVAKEFMFVTNLSSLSIGSTETPDQLQLQFLMHQHEPTIACWDVSCLKMLTYLSIENAGFAVCAQHFGATVARCLELRHLGVHLSLGKCDTRGDSRNHGWLSRLTLLTSLALRCSKRMSCDADHEVSLETEIKRRDDLYWYLRSVFEASLPSLKQLRRLDLAHNTVNRSMMHCITSQLSGSLQELSASVTPVEKQDAHCLVGLLHEAVQLSKLTLSVATRGRAMLGSPCDLLKRLGKYLCCLPSLVHLEMSTSCLNDEFDAARTISFGHWEGHASAKEPISAVPSGLTHLGLGGEGPFMWDIAEGFSQAWLASLTSLRSLDLWVENRGSADHFGRVGSNLVPMIAQQPHLESLSLSFSCHPDPENKYFVISSQFVTALAQALKRSELLTSLNLKGFDFHSEGAPQ